MWKTTDRYIQQVGRGGVGGSVGLGGLPHVLFPPPLSLFSPPPPPICLQKRLKAAEADSKLKQVYIPT